ncbi:MAG: glycosyltransferase family 4 protein [Patescibacteria group bacterium]
MERKRILLISRKYPPMIGGMETYTKNLLSNLCLSYDVDTILLNKKQFHLIWFLPYVFIKSFFLSLRHKYSVLYICDALLSPLGLIIKSIFNIKTIATVHGLDVTYPNFLYQKIVPFSLSKLDYLVCVSNNTVSECIKRGICASKCIFIPNGVNINEYYLEQSKNDVLEQLKGKMKHDFNNKKILLTTGRLIKRKGMDWFLKNIFMQLGPDFIYFVSGEGPLKRDLRRIIDKQSLKNKVFLLGKVDRNTLKLLYNSADAFIMPNQIIKSDPEGFGIVALEAASCGVPVIANAVDGIKEAVLDGKTGWLIKYNNKDAFIEKIINPGLRANSVREAIHSFSWVNLIKSYQKIIENNYDDL